ncbi:MAG: class I SAM-dependent methyltransferase [Pseudanabaenales cyanobacterium]|nr:class I SAM-dependent methyltransferase [Pseudanabaenales cyanobacterium]
MSKTCKPSELKTDSILTAFLSQTHRVDFSGKIPVDPITHLSPAIEANSFYFGNPKWAQTYFEACHRDQAFKARWQAATGSWDDKIVVDVCCGPGNLYATLGGKPRVLIGIDVAYGSLEMAQQIGYTPLLADAHNIPLTSGFADIVALNAAIHHCEDMVQVLKESARLVRPGGLLVIDHDPQLQAWNYRGLGLLLYKIRHLIYQGCLPHLHFAPEERDFALATEIHHQPGKGVTAELLTHTLEPLDFTVNLYPHNQAVGAEALEGIQGHPPHWRYRIGQLLSGINPTTPEAALSILCVAKRNP